MTEGKNGWEKPNSYWMEKSVEKIKRETIRLHISFLHVTCDGIPASHQLADCSRETSQLHVCVAHQLAACSRETWDSELAPWATRKKKKRKMHGNQCKYDNGPNLPNDTRADFFRRWLIVL